MATGTVSTAYGATPQYSVVNPATGARSSRAVALVDSGDQRAIASPTLLAQTGAPQVSTKPVVGVDGAPTTAPQYLVDWDLGRYGYVHAIAQDGSLIYTLGMDTSALGVQGLIGRNLLQTGQFSYDGPAGTFSLALGSAPPPRTAAPVSSWAMFGLLFGLGALAVGAIG